MRERESVRVCERERESVCACLRERVCVRDRIVICTGHVKQSLHKLAVLTIRTITIRIRTTAMKMTTMIIRESNRENCFTSSNVQPLALATSFLVLVVIKPILRAMASAVRG